MNTGEIVIDQEITDCTVYMNDFTQILKTDVNFFIDDMNTEEPGFQI